MTMAPKGMTTIETRRSATASDIRKWFVMFCSSLPTRESLEDWVSEKKNTPVIKQVLR